MSDYPQLQGYEEPITTGGEVSEKDLLSREKELLGEDAAEFEGSAPVNDQSDDEFGEAQSASINTTGSTSNLPSDINNSNRDLAQAEPLNTDSLESTQSSQPASGSSFITPTGAGPSAYVPQQVDLNESEFLKDWKTKNELEIERRDKVSSEKREQTRENARKSIDDFYENYNGKKETEIKEGREKAKEFEDKRDAEIGSGKGNTWYRASQLMEGLGRPAEGIEPRDKSRFAGLVDSLKDDENAPGAGGY